MIVENKKLRRLFAEKGRCESCRRTVPTDPHHLQRRGHGGGRLIDVSINLMALCRRCHDAEHAGLLTLDDESVLLRDVARRERTTPEAILAVMALLNRLDGKRGGRFTLAGRPLVDELADLGGARDLAILTLSEVGLQVEGWG